MSKRDESGVRAREAADQAIDQLPATAPMTGYLDVWIRAYREAAGISDMKFEDL